MRTEVRRGRKFIEYQDDSFPAGTLVQEIGAHDVSYQDENGAWLACDENWATDGLDGYIVKADKLNHKVRLKGNGGRAWYPRRNVATEYLTFGIPQYRTGSKWSNFGFSGWSVEGKTITLNTRQNVTVKVHSRWNGIKIDWILNNANAPVRMRYPVALTGITEIAGVLFGADGERLGQLTPTTATDANGVELACTGTYASGYVEFQADVTGAVYPVTIDPDFASGSSFGMVYGSDAAYATANSTSAGHNLADLTVGQKLQWSSYAVWRGFINFDTSAIGGSATVSQVNLRMVMAANTSDTDFDLQIVKYDWSGQDPLASGNREAAYDGCLAAAADDSIWRNTNGISTNTQYTSGNLSTAWVNKTGTTYYSLRSSRDVAATAPTEKEYISVARPDNATESYRPCLIVAYSAGSTPQNLTLSCAAGSYSLTGVACTLTYTPAAQNLTLSCGAGSLALTGSACTLSVKRNFVLSCSAGSYAVTGTAATFEVKRNFVLSCSAGSYPDMVVSGADTPSANGVYAYVGMVNGKPRYESGVGYIEYQDTWWILDNTGLVFGVYDSGYSGVATPDLVTNWSGSFSGFTITTQNGAGYQLTGSACTLTYTKAVTGTLLKVNMNAQMQNLSGGIHG